MKIIEKLNPIYQRLFRAPVFQRTAVEEPRATCDNCAMCDHGQLAPVDMGYFKPDLKCCTWQPVLANFLVGAIFSDPDPALEEGRRRLREAIASRKGITPHAVMPTAKYLALYKLGRSQGFGRAQSLLCSYYQEEGGLCTIWRYREAVCSTFFCKYQNGKSGFEYWNAVKMYLIHIESALAQVAVNTLDPSLPHVKPDQERLTAQELDDLPPLEALYSSWWGAWVGREEEFYRACYETVQRMTPEEFTAKIDTHPQTRGLLGVVDHRLDVVERRTALPDRLVRAQDLKTREAGDNVVVASYSNSDSFSMDRELFDVLAKLDPKKTLAQNLTRLDQEDGVVLEPDLLQYLFTHGVIVEPPKPTPEELAANVTTSKDRNKEKARRRSRR